MTVRLKYFIKSAHCIAVLEWNSINKVYGLKVFDLLSYLNTPLSP